MPKAITAAVLVIGNEILSGRTKDANIGFLGHELNEIGIRLLEARVVADEQSEIIDAVNALRERYRLERDKRLRDKRYLRVGRWFGVPENL